MQHRYLFQTPLLYPAKNNKDGYSYELTEERALYIQQQLEHFIPTQKPYLRSRYSIRDLADDIQVPAYQLSAYLNQEMGMNFNEYLNLHRVRYCEDLIQKGLIEELNLKGLALHCGFNNRNTLTIAFKKFTGHTPSGYTKMLL